MIYALLITVIGLGLGRCWKKHSYRTRSGQISEKVLSVEIGRKYLGVKKQFPYLTKDNRKKSHDCQYGTWQSTVRLVLWHLRRPLLRFAPIVNGLLSCRSTSLPVSCRVPYCSYGVSWLRQSTHNCQYPPPLLRRVRGYWVLLGLRLVILRQISHNILRLFEAFPFALKDIFQLSLIYRFPTTKIG